MTNAIRKTIGLLGLFAVLFGGSTLLFSQDQLNLGDGIVNNMFRGGGSNNISLLLEPQNCNGGSCILANGVASGTGHLAGNGTYTISTAATDCSMLPPVGCAGPFRLTVTATGDSIVTQTAPIQFSYTSAAGTLTGQLNFTSVSKTVAPFYSTMLGTLTITGGSFAPYFPSGGNVNITLGVTFPLQLFPQVPDAFATVEFQLGTIVPANGCNQLSSNPSNFNGTPIQAGNFIWFNANFQLVGSVTDGTTLNLTNANVSFTANGNHYVLPAPNATITFSASADCISTNFNNTTQTWNTTVPLSSSDEVFLDGLAYQVPAGGLPGGIHPVVWEGDFSSNMPGLGIQWKWGAAVYTTFNTDYNALGVKPSHTNACGYNNSDHAGTPENYKQYVIGGARGGGGSNWTGSWSGTVQVSQVCQE